METSNHSNATLLDSLAVANVTNSTVQSGPRYVFRAEPLGVRMTFAAVSIIFAVWSCFGNGFILYIKRNEKPRAVRAFSRRVTGYFVQSLALANVLFALVNCPISVVEKFVEGLTNKSDWTCRLLRYCSMVFVIITLLNMIIIVVERFLATFYPFRVPTKKAIKRTVTAAWGLGLVLAVAPSSTIRVNRRDFGSNQYTLVCAADSTDITARASITAVSVLVYFLPCVVIIVLNSCIVHRIRRGPRAFPDRSSLTSSWRFKGTRMFVSVLFTFVFPYLAPMVYITANMIFRPNISYPVEHFYVKPFITLNYYLSGVISPVIYLYCMRSTRTRMKELVNVLCCPCKASSITLYPRPVVGTAPAEHPVLKSVRRLTFTSNMDMEPRENVI